MLIAYWIIAGLTALVFVLFGLRKAVLPIPALKESGMHWVESYPPAAVRLIGVAEVVGAAGLILPMLTGIAPALSPIAAVCLAVLMLGAIATHVRLHESPVPAVVAAVFSAATAVLGFLIL